MGMGWRGNKPLSGGLIPPYQLTLFFNEAAMYSIKLSTTNTNKKNQFQQGTF
jgi:hypothetical protein